MTGDLKITLDIAQLVILGGLVWGLAKMSASVDSLRAVTTDLTRGLEKIGMTLFDMVSRVRVLEDRDRRAET
jgi:hypothetical protein